MERHNSDETPGPDFLPPEGDAENPFGAPESDEPSAPAVPTGASSPDFSAPNTPDDASGEPDIESWYAMPSADVAHDRLPPKDPTDPASYSTEQLGNFPPPQLTPLPGGSPSSHSPRPWENQDSATRREQKPQRPWTTNSGASSLAPRQTSSPVTTTLILICIAVWVAQFFILGLTERLALMPTMLYEQPWTIITNAFAHDRFSISHIFFNMFTLYLVGRDLERLLGKWRFLAIYLISALGASLFIMWIAPVYTITLGASGAIFGLFGAWAILTWKSGADMKSVWIFFAIYVFLGFAMPGVAWEGHLGGAITGAAATLLSVTDMQRTAAGKPSKERAWLILLAVGVVVLAFLRPVIMPA